MKGGTKELVGRVSRLIALCGCGGREWGGEPEVVDANRVSKSSDRRGQGPVGIWVGWFGSGFLSTVIVGEHGGQI